jgi:hypothetical protein
LIDLWVRTADGFCERRNECQMLEDDKPARASSRCIPRSMTSGSNVPRNIKRSKPVGGLIPRGEWKTMSRQAETNMNCRSVRPKPDRQEEKIRAWHQKAEKPERPQGTKHDPSHAAKAPLLLSRRAKLRSAGLFRLAEFGRCLCGLDQTV